MKFTHKPLDESLLIKLKDHTSPEGRYYYEPDKPAIRFPSITTVLSDYNKPVLTRWRKRVGEKEAVKIASKAAARGDSLHSMIERYLKNEDPTNFKYTPAHKLVFNQTRRVLDKNINNIVLQEKPLVSRTLRVAGRVDLIAEWAGKLSVIDFKGSNKPKKEEWIHHHFMQSSFYAFAFWELTGMLPKQIVIVISCDNFTVIPFVKNSAEFLPQLKQQVQNWYKNHSI